MLAATLTISLAAGAPAKRTHPATEKECAACHNDEARLTAKHFGQPVSKSPCMSCHDPHSSEYGKQLRRPLDSLCAPCHGSVPAAPFTH